MQEIKAWLTSLGLDKYQAAFADAEIEFIDLAYLTDEDLKEVGLPVGPRRRALEAIKQLSGNSSRPAPMSVPDHEPESEATNSKDQVMEDAASSSVEAERRHLTVMFVDLVGSTEMAGRFDPEDMRSIITGFQNTVAGVVGRYDGFVAKFMGDGVLCYFGWPRANEDDAERAVRAGLDIVEAVKRASGPDGNALATRIGIATGLVIVGDLIGSGATQEAAVVGETPNLAARLQSVAKPDEIVLPQQTYDLLGNAFNLQSLGSHTLKGIGEPVLAYAVRGISVRETRFDAHQSGSLTPIIGREQELRLMHDCWTKAKAGSGQMVVVTGEAGIGKSRITRAVVDKISQDDHVHFTYQCSPYHTDSAFYPIIQQLNFAAKILPSEDERQKFEKLKKVTGTDRMTTALMAELLGVSGGEKYQLPEMSPAQLRAKIMQALVQQFVRYADDKPLFVIFEDLHWIDPTTLELIDVALDAIANRQIMILGTARPNFEHGFGGHPVVTRYALNRLGREQILAITNKLTGGKSLPEEVVEIITSRTDGVPLFVEELTKTILESGVLKESADEFVLNGPLDALAIPNTLHDSLMARLDRLQPIKEVAQTAACIGREFDHQLLADISPLPASELSSALDGLINAELIYRRGLPPDAIYLFKHALVRDAAYESLLKERRRAIHNRVVKALENQPGVSPALLAYHCTESGQIDKAIDLWQLAGQQALERSANLEAIAHLSHGIALLSRLPASEELANRELKLQTMLAGPMISTKGYGATETGKVFARAQDLSEQVENTSLMYPVLYQQWVFDLINARLNESRRRADRFLELAGNQPEALPKLLGHRLVGASQYFMAEFSSAKGQLETALDLYDEECHRSATYQFGQNPKSACLAFLASTVQLMGYSDQAQTIGNAAVHHARSFNHANTLAYALFYGRVRIALCRRDLQAAIDSNDELFTLANEQGLAMWRAYAMAHAGWIFSMQGQFEDAIATARAGLEGLKQTGTALDQSMAMAQLVQAYAANGQTADAIQLVNQTLDFVEQTNERWYEAELYRLKGEQLMAANGEEAVGNAIEQFMKSLKVAKIQKAKLWELKTATSLARILMDRNDREQARNLLTPIYGWFVEGFDTTDLKVAKSLLTALN